LEGIFFIFKLITSPVLIFMKFVLIKINLADVFVGTGIKKTKAYISDIPEEKLLKKREEYWETRTEGDTEIWNILKMCCNEDMSESKI
jgi:hypothetical protein